MKRKIVSIAIASPILVLLFNFSAFSQGNTAKYDSREYWVATMVKIADPVLRNLSQEQLRAKMPVVNKDSNRVKEAPDGSIPAQYIGYESTIILIRVIL